MKTSIRTLLVAALVTGSGLALAPDAPAAAPLTQETAKEGDSGHRYPVLVEAIETAVEAAKRAAAKAKAAPVPSSAPRKEPAAKSPAPKRLHLLGVGIREKYWIGANVYSFALFMDEDAIAKDLAAFKGQKWDKLKKRDGAYNAILASKGTKELRLRFCRKVDSKDVLEAFEDSLKPRMLALQKDSKLSEKKKLEPLETFRALFDVKKIRNGHELRFTWHPDGTLSTIVNGVRKADIESAALAEALFDVYIGDDPISKASKKKLTKRLPGLLNRLVK